MNRAWHEQHRMPKNATLDERIFLNVAGSPLREQLVCLHYPRHLT